MAGDRVARPFLALPFLSLAGAGAGVAGSAGVSAVLTEAASVVVDESGHGWTRHIVMNVVDSGVGAFFFKKRDSEFALPQKKGENEGKNY